MKIKTHYGLKPIARRDHDWEAWDQDRPEAGTGFGASEQEAIDDLKEKLGLE